VIHLHEEPIDLLTIIQIGVIGIEDPVADMAHKNDGRGSECLIDVVDEPDKVLTTFFHALGSEQSLIVTLELFLYRLPVLFLERVFHAADFKEENAAIGKEVLSDVTERFLVGIILVGVVLDIIPAPTG